jgi:DNA-binding HxlR family transcriptional regulator
MSGECNGAIETALDILVGKWKPVILFHIIQKGTLRFSELQRLIPDITKKMLTTQLRELEYHDIINRKVYAQIPPKVEYSITEYGKGLIVSPNYKK